MKSGLAAAGGLLPMALAISLALPAAATSGPQPVAPESRSLAATEQSNAAASAKALGLSSGEKLTVKSVIADANGATHVRYERTVNGLRVVGGDFVSHKNAGGAVSSVTYNFGRKSVSPRSFAPKVTKAAAAQKGLATAQATKDEKSAVGELVVFMTEQGPKLAYDVLTTGIKADQVPTRQHTYVDANTGAVLATNDEIKTGSGRGIHTGDNTIETKAHTGGGYEMTDTHGNTATDVHNQGNPNTSEGPAGDLFLDADDAWGNGTNSDRASAAVDALLGATKTFEYYKNHLGRNGIWNDGRGAPSRVHFANAMVNAFWDGQQMSYGDGANNAAPLTELDVAGHEMSHGVTENTANLNYSGDAGGLNEATSDIFGTAVEWYANLSADAPDYLIGEEININGNGTPLRYMDKPSKDGRSVDCWSSSTGGMDPHFSSGPLNHWYYMLSEGSGAKTIGGVSYNSPTCGGAAAVTGITHLKAEKIWYRTLSTYLTSGSNYAAARTGAIKSAKDLYGQGSTECLAVASAFTAIAVPAGTESCGTGTPTDPTITNPGAQTSTVGTADSLQLAATGGTAPYTWSATGLPAGLSLNVSTGLISGTPTTAGSSTVAAKVTDSTSKTATVNISWTVSTTPPPSGVTLANSIALSNCSASLVRFPASTGADRALMLTNGHCLPTMPTAGQVITNQAATRTGTLLKADGTSAGTLTSDKVIYATMTGTDVALYQLNETFDALKSRIATATPYTVASTQSAVGSVFSIPSGYHKRIWANCSLDGIVKLKEATWTWTDSIRYDANCDTIGGTSGSPIVSTSNGQVIGINNTGNESGQMCTMNNPCEVAADGTTSVRQGTSYGQQTWWFTTCLNSSRQVDLTVAGCKLAGATTTPPTGGTLKNGGFESGQTSWTGTSGPITNNSGRPAHSGTWKLWLGGNGSTSSENESQTFAVPAAAVSPTLTYWIRIDTAETTSTTQYDKATVAINGVTKHAYSNVSTPKSTWSQKTIDLSAYKGQNVTLKFAMTEDSSLQTSFVIDDVATSF